MKMLGIAAAAVVALTSFSAVPASAQRERTVTRTTITRHVEGNHGWRNKRVCTVRWNHNRKVRSCRTIRVRR